MLVALPAGHRELLPGVAVWSAGMLLRTGAAPLRSHPAFFRPLLPLPSVLHAGSCQLSASLPAGSVSAVCRGSRAVRAPRGCCARAGLFKSGRAPRTTTVPTECPGESATVGAARHGQQLSTATAPRPCAGAAIDAAAISARGSARSYRVLSAELVAGSSNLCSTTSAAKAIRTAFAARVGQAYLSGEDALVGEQQGRHVNQTGQEHQQANHQSSSTGEQDGAGGDIETGKYARLGRFIQAVEQGLNGAVE